ncbi:orotate phosphoribosyltransferase [Candidatus Peregrinibacteria bacterium RIFOXYC2_FULL_33_13]|nr:MAG: Orotate phosphoribosyltransferase [Candidatus Peregrinibacteria bacterium GW2011_GWA2_33_10]KKP39926.1 MAG: orotate phosphoribosyltransferase, orotate phosphoribosyltransferase [Candidatus Peregrinibacteria bacterium GW2011_GWC2_33_13]OGJ47404.1 MAG: orotate phosphoribosyltransferase [Candidatus Peregrinibacteria bacterium RIFOXYA2_FULL_33_7]OGJ53532.1 MAG: orotate phosphoribosyltransferase [Candidatus Peregrinibacteria bacterium RIFOXYC2_FULL_33_13]
MNLARDIAETLLSIEAVKVKTNPPFTWASGIKSPIYCDNRKLISYPDGRKKVVEGFKQLIREKNIQFDVIGGTATAAIPWASFLAYDLNVPMIYIRPEKKDHGSGKQVEGELKEGKRVLIVEDLISTGGSSVSAAEAVRNEGKCEVSDIIAIVSWELRKSIDQFAQANINLYTLTDYTNIIGMAKEKGNIKGEEYQIVLEFKEDPAAWGGKYGF